MNAYKNGYIVNERAPFFFFSFFIGRSEYEKKHTRKQASFIFLHACASVCFGAIVSSQRLRGQIAEMLEPYSRRVFFFRSLSTFHILFVAASV